MSLTYISVEFELFLGNWYANYTAINIIDYV